MKRVHVVLIATSICCLLIASVGCGKQPGGPETAAQPGGAQQSSQQQGAAPAQKGLLAHIKEKGVITIGTSNDVPFSYIDPNTRELKGIDAEFMLWMADKMGVKVETYVTDFSTLIPALKAKKFDIIVDAMYITDQRKEQINFTDPWYKEGEGLIVRKDDESIKSLDDLKGKVVGAQTGTVFLDFVKSLPGVKEVKVYDSQATALMDLNNGRVDAVITDSATAAYAIKNDPNLKLKLVSPYEPRFTGIIGAGVRKEDTDLLEEMNRLLKELKASGKDLEILQKYGLGPENRMP